VGVTRKIAKSVEGRKGRNGRGDHDVVNKKHTSSSNRGTVIQERKWRGNTVQREGSKEEEILK